MEAQLDRSNTYLVASKEEHRSHLEDTQIVSSWISHAEKMRDLPSKVESLSKKFTTTKGLHRWKPVCLTKSDMSFHLIGPSPKSSIRLSFWTCDKGIINIKAQVDPTVFRDWNSRLTPRFRAVSTFLEARASALVDEISSRAVPIPRQIGALLREYELRLGRVEHTASELAMLHRRYNALLTPSETRGSDNFQVEVDFSSSNDSSKLSATFQLSDAYPFVPLDVHLETFKGEIDEDELNKLLIKNAKPGFGYLSRTCAVISAFMR